MEFCHLIILYHYRFRLSFILRKPCILFPCVVQNMLMDFSDILQNKFLLFLVIFRDSFTDLGLKKSDNQCSPDMYCYSLFLENAYLNGQRNCRTKTLLEPTISLYYYVSFFTFQTGILRSILRDHLFQGKSPCFGNQMF